MNRALEPAQDVSLCEGCPMRGEAADVIVASKRLDSPGVAFEYFHRAISYVVGAMRDRNGKFSEPIRFYDDRTDEALFADIDACKSPVVQNQEAGLLRGWFRRLRGQEATDQITVCPALGNLVVREKLFHDSVKAWSK